MITQERIVSPICEITVPPELSSEAAEKGTRTDRPIQAAGRLQGSMRKTMWAPPSAR